MTIQEAIHAVTEHRDLAAEEMSSVMRTIMTGQASPAQIGGFLIGLRMKGETVEEIAAAAAVMRELATPVDVDDTHLVDTCGTGGDASGTFNISTASAFVVAAGSADVLEAAGVKLDLRPDQVTRCIEEVGVGFLFAPQHHGAMKHAIGPRKEMGVRTVFNLLGPLTNPAGAPNQVVGVFSAQWIQPIAEVLAKLGSRHVLVVNAEDGLDEISIGSPTRIAEFKQGSIRVYTVTPQDFEMQATDLSTLKVNSAEESLILIRQVLRDHRGPAHDIVCLNAGAAIYVAGLAEDLSQGIAMAAMQLSNGKAEQVLNALIAFTNRF
jgi:anthranilate phosphoribosyltransferase